MRAVAIAAWLALAAPATAQHDHGAGASVATPPAAWTQHPLLTGKVERGARGSVQITASGMTAQSVTVFASGGPADRRKLDYPIGPQGAKIESAAPRAGNYHWLVAREETPEGVRVASTAWYFPNPGDSPRHMLDTPKHELEIVPVPLPREHRSYRESEKWRFLVRFRDQPLAGQRLTLETEHGTRTSVATDADGLATVVFPRDYKPEAGAHAHDHDAPRGARFVLSAEKTDAGRRYQTAFNYSYGEDPERSRSLAWGVAFGVLGMVAATPLLRRRKQGAKDHA